jgi:hypothetical protein
MRSRTATTFGGLSLLETNPLQILRVLHGKRNVKRILNR